MNRVAERVLAIISIIFTVLSIFATITGAAIVKMLNTDTEFRNEMEMEFNADPTMAPEDVELLFTVLDGFGDLLWVAVGFLVVSLILTIIGLVKIWNNKNAKLAGIMFILGGLTAGIISLTSILLYIAGIMCLTKKEILPEEDYKDSLVTDESPTDDGMRPL